MNMKMSLLIATLGTVVNLYAQEATPSATVSDTTAAPAAEQNAAAIAEAPASSEAPAAAEAAPAEEVKAEETAAVNPEKSAEETATAETSTPATNETAPAANETTPAEAANETAHETARETAENVPAAETTPEQVAVADTATTSDSVAVPQDSTAPIQEPAQTAEKPTKGPLDVLHANIYNAVGNEAAAATIGGNIAAPRKMYGIKGLYLEPTNERAALAFGNTTTYFLAFDNSQSMGLLTAGVAFQKFGVSVDGSFGKQWNDAEYPITEQNEKITYGGSSIGATASLQVGSFDIVASGHYVKPESEGYSADPFNKWEQNIWDATGKLALSYSGEEVFWTFGVEGLRHSFTTDTKVTVEEVIKGEKNHVITKSSVSDTSSRIEFEPTFNIGAAVLKAEDARIYLGVNTRFPFAIYDEIENIMDSHTRFSAFVTPNIFGEVALNQHMMIFGGANLDWNVFSYEKYELADFVATSRTTFANTTTVNLGSRFEYGRVAAELAFTKQFLQNPFGSFSTTDGFAVDLGLFVNF